MRHFTGVLVAVISVAAFAAPEHCDPSYDCAFNYVSQLGFVYEFDFSKLCSSTQYTVSDNSTGQTYNFNVCGYAASRCLPEWTNIFQYGVAIQSFGAVPACDHANPGCIDPDTGNKTCCTAPCQVLGTGLPVWDVADPADLNAGVTVTHFGVPPSAVDPFSCPYDPKTGEQEPRRITYHLTCAFSADPLNPTLENIRVNETSPCNYLISAETSAACGCVPNCGGRNCGDDGCGGVCGNCPWGYNCNDLQQCCKPDCRGRDCGDDGCGGTCGSCRGTANICLGRVCVDNSTDPSGPGKYKGKEGTGGAWTGGIFVGMLLAVVIAGIVMFIHKRRTGTWTFDMGSSAAEDASLASRAHDSEKGGYNQSHDL